MRRFPGIVLLVCVLLTGCAIAAEKAPSYPKGNGLRIVSTGHNWVAPAMKTLGPIALAAGFDGHHQCSHLSGGSTGSARSIWAAEKGLDFPGREFKPGKPILFPAIETGQWDVMTFGSYNWDRLEDYTNWIDVCLKANPNMVFYVQDGWPFAHDGMVAPDKYDIDKFLEAQRKFKVPDDDLDKVFRRVAWQVVTHHPLSGVTDKDGDGNNPRSKP